MLVNGAPWPVLEVAARKYRFRILNASNAMPIRLALSTDQPMTQIATDQGLLPSPVVLPTIGLAMGERVEARHRLLPLSGRDPRGAAESTRRWADESRDALRCRARRAR